MFFFFPEGVLPAVPQKKLCIVEFRLDSFVGHMFNYVNSIYREALSQGFAVRVWGGKKPQAGIAEALPVEPVFDTAFRPSLTGFRALDFILRPLQANWNVYRELCSAGDRPGRGWVVFAGDASVWNLAALALWVRRFPRGDAPAFVFCLRYSYFCGGRRRREAVWLYPALRLLERLAATYEIRLITDSARLEREYASLTSLPVAVLPIPHTDAAGEAAAAAGDVDVLSLGAARYGKGFDLLAEAIRLLHERGETRGLRFTLQCYSMADPWHDMRVPVEMLRSLRLPGLRLVEETVDEKGYRDLLLGAGALAVPYRADDYAAATSGIFTEALAAGKPVIATAGTWMADQLDSFGAGVVFRDGDAADLARAIVELRDNYPALAARARERSAAWREYHSPGNFFRELQRTAGTL